jgi:hypothetical protein
MGGGITSKAVEARVITTLLALLGIAVVYFFVEGRERLVLFGVIIASIALLRFPSVIRDLLPKKLALLLRPVLFRVAGLALLLFTLYRLFLRFQQSGFSFLKDIPFRF